MTPEEKAEELFGKFAMYLRANLRYDEEANEDAKQCALIAVDEIIDATKGMVDEDNGYSTDSYWQEVKHEIELL